MNTDTIMAAATQAMDERYPGWESRIDWSSLDLEDPCNCIAAQGSGITSDMRNFAWYRPCDRMRDILGVSRGASLRPHPFAQNITIPLWREFIEARLARQAVVEEEMYV